jgi:hypothetical protein
MPVTSIGPEVRSTGRASDGRTDHPRTTPRPQQLPGHRRGHQQVLFKRVAAVVHHGGAGATTAAARAAMPQVTVPQFYEQHYWAQASITSASGRSRAGRALHRIADERSRADAST